MPIKSALEALEASLASGGTPVVETDEEEIVQNPPTGDEDEASTEDETDDEAKESTDETGEEGDETSSEDDESAAAETPEAKAAREKLEKTEERGTGDILEDPIPKTLGPRGQERMRTLISTVKELQPDAAAGRELMGHIEASNMTADEFSMALTFGRLKHSDNIEDNRQALAILMQGVKELCAVTGESLPGVDLLEGHADLQQRVAAKTLDPKDAAELAAGRNRKKAEAAAATRSQTNAQTAQQRAQQSQQQAAAVKKELNDLGADLSANDPQFEAKMKAMTKDQKAKINAAPLGLRVNAFLKTYMAVKLPAKGAAPAGGKKPGPQPMRAGKVPAAGGGGVRREAKSAVEAMDFALGLK